MPFSAEKGEQTYGSAWHVNGASINALHTYVTYAGTPSGNVVPAFIGQWLFDTANEDFYLATGLDDTDWKQVTA